MSEPSTAWKEVAAEGEAQRLEQLAEALAGMQTGLFTKYGKGRALHRKAQGILQARLDVDGDLPAPARHGIFASKKSFDVVVRLSNASALLQKDATGVIGELNPCRSDGAGRALARHGQEGADPTAVA